MSLSTAGDQAMARTLSVLPNGSRITDYMSLGVITKTFPLERVRAVLATTGKNSLRERDLPAHVVVYYAIALALYMQSSYREVLRCLLEEILQERVDNRRDRQNTRCVKRKMSNWPLSRGRTKSTQSDNVEKTIQVVK
jgi:hypothetical protein